MKRVSVIIIGDNTFVREGIIAAIARSRFRVSGVLSSIDNFSLTRAETALWIAIVRRPSGQEALSLVGRIREISPKSSIALLFECSEEKDLRDLFDAGVSCCLPLSIRPEALVMAMELILGGELILSVPLRRGVEQEICPEPVDNDVISSAVEHNGKLDLSYREKQVLSYIANGAPNKTIARRLAISDATVKVHVRMVLKKIGAANRTQAAVRAYQANLCLAPASEAFETQQEHREDGRPA